jgi:hypothetical protein
VAREERCFVLIWRDRVNEAQEARGELPGRCRIQDERPTVSDGKFSSGGDCFEGDFELRYDDVC